MPFGWLRRGRLLWRSAASWGIRAGLLRLEEEVRQDGDHGAAPGQTAGGREPEGQELVAGLSLDKQMLQDVLSKEL